MPNTDQQHAKDVIEVLRGFTGDIRALMDAIGDRSSIPQEEVQQLQANLKDLKDGLKQAAKFGTVDGTKRPHTGLESAFFQPAVHDAVANFLVSANSHPLKSNWFSVLYGIEIDIQNQLGQLENEYPDV